MPRYCITLEYKGTNYSGWQIQDNATTIQGILQDRLSQFFGKDIKIVGSGRTDAGTHAIGQVAHFDCDSDIPAEKIPFIINPLLPEDISILDCATVLDDFHARFSAKSKTYQYKVYISRHLRPLKEDTYYRIIHSLRVDKMKDAAKLIVGEHDFRCFLSSGSSVVDTVRTVYAIDIEAKDNDVIFTIKGNGFLYNMVRIMVGTLLDVGRDKLTLEELNDIILDKRRDCAGKTLPAKGLCLIRVEY